VKGTTVGTITDAEGSYTLSMPSDANTLVFSSVGYENQEASVDNQSTLNIQMAPDVRALSEVVVIGYGEQSREVVTSSISKVEGASIQNTPSVHPVQALQGRAAGLSVNVTSGQPGDGAQVFIRGGTTPNPRDQNNEPLYVVDGVFREDLVGINPNDIESIEVLKDAASAAIYGARAANGVILINTKTGKGAQGGRIRVQYAYGIDEQIRQYPWTSAEDYIRVSRIAAQRGINLGNPGERLNDTQFGYSTQVISEPGEYGQERVTTVFLDDVVAVEGQPYVDGLINEQGFQTMEDPVTGRIILFKDNNYDENHLFQTGTSHDVNINASGGGENGNYNVSIGYLGQEGTVRGTASDRFTALANGVYNIRENLRVEAGFNYQFDNIEQPRSDNGTINRSSRLPHTYRIWNDDGTPALGESPGSPRNIEHELFYQDDSYRNFRTQFRLGFDYEITDGLSLKSSASVYRRENLLDRFERASPEISSRDMRRDHDTFNQVMIDGLLTYDKIIGEGHNVNALLGTQYVQDTEESFRGDGANAPTDLITTLNASETERERVTSFYSEGKLLSFFGRLNYDFKAKYLFGFSLRYDGSSRFATNNQWGLFPAVSAGWNLHQESFFTVEPISRLKLRASWGQAGNDNLSISDTRGLFSPTSYQLIGGVRASRLPNFDLKWETTTTTDIGLDVGLFKNRVNVLVDFYNKLTSDRLIDRPLPAQTGFGFIRSNFGSLRNRGIEVEIGGTAVQTGDFIWDVNFNFAFNQQTITELPDNDNAKNRINGGIIWDENGNEVQVGGLAEGERPFGLWAFEYMGVYTTDAEAAEAPDDLLMSGGYRTLYGGQKNGGDAIWRDTNGDNIIDVRDLVFVGYPDPNQRGGWLNTFTYKNLSLRFVMDWATGHVISNGWRSRSNGNARNNVMTLTDVIDGGMWQEQGDQAAMPRYDVASDFDNGPRNHFRTLHNTSNREISNGSGDGADQTFYYHEGDWLAFREVSLSYQLPTDLVNKAGFTDTRLSLELYNLGYLTRYDGLTPEHYDGIDEGIYPRPLQFRIRLPAGL
jgi:TonB-linked SusC/RagA family outer membrane protein